MPARLILALGWVVVGAVLVAAGWGMVSPAPAPAAEPSRPAAEPWPIPPGREAAVMRLLEPVLEGGFLGWQVEGVRIEGSAIRVSFEGGDEQDGCGEPDWIEPPGTLQLGRGTAPPWPPGEDDARRGHREAGPLLLAWALCGEAPRPPGRDVARLVRRLDRRNDGSVWKAARGAPTRGTSSVGLLDPPARALGLAPATLTVGAWLLGLCAALGLALLAARPTRAPPAGSRSSGLRARHLAWAVAALVVLGAGLRVHASASWPLDGDEHPWAFAAAQPVFGDDHDALVHPPVYRAMQRTWMQTLGSGEATPLWQLRLPSTLAGVLALVTVALVLVARARTWAGLLPLAIAACAPPVVHASTLARPYAVAALLVTVAMAAAALLGEGGRRMRWLAGALAAAAAGAAGWVDLLAGAGAAAGVVLLSLDGRQPRRALALAAAILLFNAPLWPGALQAATEHGAPAGAEATAGAPLYAPETAGGPARGWIGGGGWAHASARVMALGVVGHASHSPWLAGAAAVLAGAVLGASMRGRRWLGAWTPLLGVAVGWAASHVLGLRVRNVLFVAYGTALLYGLLAMELPWRSWLPGALARPFRRSSSSRGGADRAAR